MNQSWTMTICAAVDGSKGGSLSMRETLAVGGDVVAPAAERAPSEVLAVDDLGWVTSAPCGVARVDRYRHDCVIGCDIKQFPAALSP